MSEDAVQLVEVAPEPVEVPASGAKPESLIRKRIRKFRRLKRGYYSFVLLLTAYIISFLLPGLVIDKALVGHYHGRFFFPIIQFRCAAELGVKDIRQRHC